METSLAFDDILNDCLERMAGGEDPGQCVSRYPEHAEELMPLLAMAAATSRVAASVTPRPEARARGFERFNRVLAEKGVRSRSRLPVFLGPLGKPIVLGFALVLLTAVAAGGTTMASEDAVPGDTLYWVKTTKENITLRMNGSDMAKARTHARLAGERGEEIGKLIAHGRFKDAEELVARMNRHLDESAMLAGVLLIPIQAEMPVRHTLVRTTATIKIRASLEHDGIVMKTQLLQLWSEAPPNQKPMVRQILRRTQVRYQIFIEALDDEMPPGRPFWIVQPSGPRQPSY